MLFLPVRGLFLVVSLDLVPPYWVVVADCWVSALLLATPLVVLLRLSFLPIVVGVLVMNAPFQYSGSYVM